MPLHFYSPVWGWRRLGSRASGLTRVGCLGSARLGLAELLDALPRPSVRVTRLPGVALACRSWHVCGVLYGLGILVGVLAGCAASIGGHSTCAWWPCEQEAFRALFCNYRIVISRCCVIANCTEAAPAPLPHPNLPCSDQMTELTHFSPAHNG